VGRWIVDDQGRVVIVHGLNIVAKLPPYTPEALGFGADDAAFLARQGFSAVRLGIVLKGLEPRPGRFDDRYLASIARTVRVLERHGLAPLIDFHQDMYNERFQGEGFPDWMVQDDGLPALPRRGFPGNYGAMPGLSRAYDRFWANSPGPGGLGLQDYYATAWAHVARYFRRDPALLGFDIFNEPFPGSLRPADFPGFARGALTAFNRRTFGAIRTVDRRRLLFYEPALQFAVGFTDLPAATGDATAGFSFHVYCSGFPDQACAAREQRGFRAAEAQSTATGDALLLSEFGATDRLTTLAAIVRSADAEMVPWLEWSYWNRDPSSRRDNEGLIRKLGRPPRGDNVKRAKLRVLARPYPQAIAGMPERFGFDPLTRTFQLAYTTARAGGGMFAAGTRTVVSMPPIAYPAGYAATAAGATIVSRPGAAALQLTAKPGAREVRLTVSARP
jgi:endoglycosylceramidase